MTTIEAIQVIFSATISMSRVIQNVSARNYRGKLKLQVLQSLPPYPIQPLKRLLWSQLMNLVSSLSPKNQ